MDSFIFKGKSSEDFKIIVNSLPSVSKPPLRVEEIEIDGVDGTKYEDLGYGSYDKKIKITITEDNIDSLIGWLKGEGDLTLSNESDKYYKAKIINQIDFERLMKYEPAEITFRVQPFKYEYQEEEQITATGSVEGKAIKITDAKATEIKLYGRSIQNGEPTPDTPVEIESVGYENLFDKDQTPINAYLYGNKIVVKESFGNRIIGVPCKPNKTYIIHRKIFSNEFRVATYNDELPSTTSSQVSYNCFNEIDNDSGKNIIITTDSNSKYLLVQYGSTGDTNLQESLETVMVEEGLIAHPYIPYAKYAIEVKTLGKNKFNEEQARINSNYIPNSNLGSSWKTITMDLLPNTEYTITRFANNVSVDGGFNIQFYLYEDTTNPLFYINNATAEKILNKKTATFSTGDSGKIYLAHLYGNDERLTNLFNNIDIQIEKGMLSTDYDPYKENTSIILLNEPLRSLTNEVKDIAYIKNDKLYVDRCVDSIVLDGSEGDWIQLSATIDDKYLYQHKLVSGSYNDSKVNAKSNYYKGYSASYLWNAGVDGITLNSSGYIQIRSSITTKNEFKTWLSTHNTQVDYELATPVTEELGDLTILDLLDGENNISNSADTNMIIDYVDNKLIINNLGNYVSKPIFEIEGVGTIKFILNGGSIFTYNFDDDEKVVIDSEKEDAYLGLVLKNRNMNGEFPVLDIGENIITWDGLIKNISVSKKSRWL